MTLLLTHLHIPHLRGIQCEFVNCNCTMCLCLTPSLLRRWVIWERSCWKYAPKRLCFGSSAQWTLDNGEAAVTPAHCARDSSLLFTYAPPAIPSATKSHFQLSGAEVGLGYGVVCTQQPQAKAARLQLEPLYGSLNIKSNPLFLHVFQLKDWF